MAKHAPASDSDALLEITIGILTYQRPWSLTKTLNSLLDVDTACLNTMHDQAKDGPGFRVVEVVVVDNDAAASAAEPTAAWASEHGLDGVVRHVHEPEPGLAAARNRALSEASAPILIFIDDDEVAEPGWPGGLVDVVRDTGAALVGGPVNTRFEHEPPDWIIDGGHFERDEHEHGQVMPWLRSGNLAIDLTQIRPAEVRFDPRFGLTGGEDVAFSRAAIDQGLTLRWSTNGAVTEVVGPERTTRRWLTNRARRTTASYVRAHMATDATNRRRASTVARGLVRMTQGIATVLVGAVTLHYGRVTTGLITAYKGVGFIEGLLGRRGTSYGRTAR